MKLPTADLKKLLPVILSVLMGLVAVALVRSYITGERRKLDAERQRLWEDYRDPVEIIVAARDIPEGTMIAERDLAFLSTPEKFIQPYATPRPKDLIGKVAVVPFAEGEQVLRNKIRLPSEIPLSSTLSGVTPEGKRAVTIETNALTGVGGFVRPSDKVDILWTVKLPEAQGGDTVTMMLFQSVSILAVGNQMVGQVTGEQGASSSGTVTLSLTPKEASLLLYARDQGRLQLSLRPRTDPGQPVAVPLANSRTLMESILGKGAVLEPPPRPAERTVEVYKGLRRSIVSVKD